ncbi:MAG: acyltransferase [Leptospiraceae bacterium]|nr:acyltransferase [Leptospiraceae bacterium]
MTYRPDVDGLRAIAVLSVIIYHFSRKFLPGGYLGVDIFFVLSGYLITTIIWREILEDKFSIIRFYDRRVRRIFPALLIVLIATTVISILIFLPLDLIGFAKSIFATLTFVANIYFWRDTNYFSRVAEEKPLLHLWSLGVEEQFYLLFPLLLLFLFRKAKSWTLIVLVGFCFGSLVSNVFALKFGANLPAFYLLPTRVWEICAGAIIALLPTKFEFTPKTMAGFGYAGLTLIIVSLTTSWHWNLPFVPDPFFVVLGTTFILYSGLRERHLVNSLLSRRWIVFIGLISYSLYLWHWPVIVFLKYYLVRDLTISEMIGATIFMLSAAIVSWRYIESPFRSTLYTIQRVRRIVITLVMILTIVAGVIIIQSGFPNRLNPAAMQINSAVGTNYRCDMSDYLYFDQSRACVLELPSRNPNDADVVLLGNSHAQMYAPLFREIFRSHSLFGLLVPANGCLPTYDININSECTQLANRNIDGVIKLDKTRVVVLSTTWDSFIAKVKTSATNASSAQMMIDGLDKTINRIIRSGKKVILIGPIVTPGWDVASITGRNLAFGRSTELPLYTSMQDFQDKYSSVIAHFENRNDIVFVRPDEVQCSSGRCDYVIDGHSLFSDDNHLAIAELWRFQKIFEKALTVILHNK